MAQAQRQAVDQAFAQARASHAAGRLTDAKAAYERVLTMAPGHPQALTMLASICYRLGSDSQADAYLDRAIDIYRAALNESPKMQRLRAGFINLLLARDRVAEAETEIRSLLMPLVPMRADPDEFERIRKNGREKNLPPIMVNTLPKTASESIWNKLARGLGAAQCHVSIGLFPDCCAIPSRVHQLAEGGASSKEHLPATAHNLATLADAGIRRMVMHVRDPRQATLSWAHFVKDEVGKRPLGPLWRKIVPPADVLGCPMKEQLDWHIAHYLPRVVRYIGEWLAVADDPGNDVDIAFMTFEAFKRDPTEYYGKVLDFLDIDRQAFEAEAEAETIHLRKGKTDEWRGVFKPIQRDRASDKIPREMAERLEWAP